MKTQISEAEDGPTASTYADCRRFWAFGPINVRNREHSKTIISRVSRSVAEGQETAPSSLAASVTWAVAHEKSKADMTGAGWLEG
jgi:hypothetical protein